MHIQSIRIAHRAEDRRKVFDLRRLGYRKYADTLMQEDILDSQANCTLILGEDQHGRPVGTMRILESLSGPIELHSFVDLTAILPPSQFQAEQSIAEASRFTILSGAQSKELKLLLWKTFYLFCLDRGVEFMLACVRKPAARDYLQLFFDDVGAAGQFIHPHLGQHAHYTYIAHAPSLERRFRATQHPLADFFLNTPHPFIDLS